MRFRFPISPVFLSAWLATKLLASGQELQTTLLGESSLEVSWPAESITPEGRTAIYPSYKLQKSSDLIEWEMVLQTEENPLVAEVQHYALEFELGRAPVFFRLAHETNLVGVDLSTADLEGSDLRGLDFTAADLSGAVLRNADLSGANLTSVDLRGANLDGAVLEDTVLFDVQIDEATVLDSGVRARIEGTGSETDIVINEVRSSGDDEIELYNVGASSVDLTGWKVADENSTNTPYVFPDGTVLEPGAYLVLTKGTDHDFGLGGADQVSLRSPSMTVDEVVWASGAATTSYCRVPNGTGSFMPCAVATLGGENSTEGMNTVVQPMWVAGGEQGSARGTQFDEPNELSFDRNGNLWAGDVNNLRLQVFDAEGNFLRIVGEAGDGLGQFVDPVSGKKGPEAIAVDGNNHVYVVDRGGAKINVYDGATFEPLREIRSDLFVDPTGLTMDSSGCVFVADQGTDQVYRFDSEGNHLGNLQELREDAVTPVLQKTETLGIDEGRNWLFASSEDASRIEVFHYNTGAWTGNHIAEIQSGSVPEPGRVVDDVEGFAVDLVNSLLFISDEDNGRVLVHNLDSRSGLTDPETNFAFLGSFGQLGSGAGEFLSADGIAVMPEQDRLAIADQGNFRIQVFKLSDIMAALP